MMDMLQKIKDNAKTCVIDDQELHQLLLRANVVYRKHFSDEVYYERSVFINWTCAIADCKYCFLSTKPKHQPGRELKAIRSKESILAEILVCKALGWDIGYITGGLRVESAPYLIDLIQKINVITGDKIMMNFGPYPRSMIEQFKPYVQGMGSAIESFDEELHNFICPSKPLRSLLTFLDDLQALQLQKLITIILGLGETKDDVFTVIDNIKRYQIEKIQLCFLKSQKNTIFDNVPSPNIKYMAYWVAQIRIHCPIVQIKVALVKERMDDFSLLLQAGANGFSRFMAFTTFATPLAKTLEKECQKAGRTLRGNFTSLPAVDVDALVNGLPFPDQLKSKMLPKVKQYYRKLQRRQEKNNPPIFH